MHRHKTALQAISDLIDLLWRMMTPNHFHINVIQQFVKLLIEPLKNVYV